MIADTGESPGRGSPASGARGVGHGLPALLINRQHVITHQGCSQLIGGPFGLSLNGRHQQQIGIREASPIAPGQGAVAEGLSAGVPPNAAIVGPEGVVQAPAQRRDPPLPLPAA
jgi:hypothetical protein